MRSVIIRKEDRIMNHIYPFLVYMDSFYFSMKFQKDGIIEKDYSGFVTVEGMSVKMEVRLPLCGPIRSVIENRKPDFVEVVFVENEKVGEVNGERGFTSEIIDYLFNPMFINYYESVKPLIEKTMGSTSKNQSNWTNDIFRMGWLVRNSLSHDKKVSFSDSNSKEIEWRGKVIDTSYHNEQLYQHLNFTDIFILMFDIDDELNKVLN
jgi:hypothetical protein